MESIANDAPKQSLVAALQERILHSIRSISTPGGWKVVVVDRPSLKIISSVLKMHSVLDEKVMAVELISRSRQPYYDLDALYFLVPCAQSISMLTNDFSAGPQSSSDRPLYAHAHLFFTGALPTPLFRQLSASRVARYIPHHQRALHRVQSDRVAGISNDSVGDAFLHHVLATRHCSADGGSGCRSRASAQCHCVAPRLKPYIRYYRPGLRRDISAVDISHVSPGMCTTGMPRDSQRQWPTACSSSLTAITRTSTESDRRR
ncbi:Sec1-like protein [Linderina pennispora]|uniref:Sec1-like protein n=1 Tax=Linderina pennispora TaxID=61395 RepID=A0A1Y1WDK5_9FUNG|nr:Sec1-like protein [Linderina pennispora]ORX71418.1 Sec1-like protein [Linderina pennispora]